jgi:hypothetical protein
LRPFIPSSNARLKGRALPPGRPQKGKGQGGSIEVTSRSFLFRSGSRRRSSQMRPASPPRGPRDVASGTHRNPFWDIRGFAPHPFGQSPAPSTSIPHAAPQVALAWACLPANRCFCGKQWAQSARAHTRTRTRTHAHTTYQHVTGKAARYPNHLTHETK